VNWETISSELREVIKAACTPRQIDVVKLQAAGASQRKIARMLDVDPITVRGLLDRAHRRIRHELARRDAAT
jgi:DNA-binding CsgD family transcriptional regulator